MYPERAPGALRQPRPNWANWPNFANFPQVSGAVSRAGVAGEKTNWLTGQLTGPPC